MSEVCSGSGRRFGPSRSCPSCGQRFKAGRKRSVPPHMARYAPERTSR